jgi:hypothetical protein
MRFSLPHEDLGFSPPLEGAPMGPLSSRLQSSDFVLKEGGGLILYDLSQSHPVLQREGPHIDLPQQIGFTKTRPLKIRTISNFFWPITRIILRGTKIQNLEV